MLSTEDLSMKYSTTPLQAITEPMREILALPAPSLTTTILQPLSRFLKAKSSSLDEPTFACERPRFEETRICLSPNGAQTVTSSSFQYLSFLSLARFFHKLLGSGLTINVRLRSLKGSSSACPSTLNLKTILRSPLCVGTPMSCLV